MQTLTPAARGAGAATGAFIGDALAMPAHWYYDRAAIRADYGVVDTYHAPRRLHPSSILWRSTYEPTEPEFDILGDERMFWGKRDIHYHQHLRPGENTLNLKLLRAALEELSAHGEYRQDVWIDRYLDFMRSPADHRDTYVEECHRGFFMNLRSGLPPEKCAVKEKHIGGLVPVVPLYAALRTLGAAHDAARRTVHDHVALTHGGELVREAVSNLLAVAEQVWSGEPLREIIERHAGAQDLRFLTGPVSRLVSEPDEKVVGGVWSTACYLDESLPATFFLALKYADSPRRALIANTMVGGDNCHRGAVLGALLGLAGGPEVFPAEWRNGLVGSVPGG